MKGEEHVRRLVELHEAGRSMHAFSNYPIWYNMIEERLALSRRQARDGKLQACHGLVVCQLFVRRPTGRVRWWSRCRRICRTNSPKRCPLSDRSL